MIAYVLTRNASGFYRGDDMLVEAIDLLFAGHGIREGLVGKLALL
jgi:hypothetical protein